MKWNTKQHCVIMFNEAPFFENLRVGFHQVVRDVITC